MRALLAWLLCWPALAGAALEEWPCNGLADFYGFVAVDRDAGVTFKDRSNKAVRDIITTVDSEAGAEVTAEDARALLNIVRYVYLHQGTAYTIRREALLRCLKGHYEPPTQKRMGWHGAS